MIYVKNLLYLSMEIWKDIDYKQLRLSVSSKGKLKLNPSIILDKTGYDVKYIRKYEDLKVYYNQGYELFTAGGVRGSVHIIMAMAFLNHVPDGYRLVVDHIDNNPSNNVLENLQVVTARKNSTKDRKNKSSKYAGVFWNKNTCKWVAQIYMDKKVKYLGSYDKEKNASNAYQRALKEIN